jgi:ATP-binding cassette subfamily C protein
MLLATSLSAMLSQSPVNLPVIGAIPPGGYIWILIVVCGLIILKSVLAIAFQWMATRRMAGFELEIGDQLFSAYIRAPWTERLKRNTAQLVRLADVGIANVTAGFLLPIMSLPSLLVTSIAVAAVIVAVEPVTAIVTIVYLGFIAFLLYFVLSKRTLVAGRVNRDYSFRVASLMTDMVAALKEITLRNKSAEVAEVVHANRVHTSRARANLSFLGVVPRFVLDSALIGGFLLVGGVAYLTGGMESAISAVALFGVAGFRLVPSLTGFQALVNQMSANIPQVEAVMSDIDMARGYIEHAETIGHEPIYGSPRSLQLRDVSFFYPGSDTPSLRNVSVDVPIGATIGIVGASGAGKSTLVDVLLGLLVPTGGSIRLDDQDLSDVLAAWRDRVGYVPQDVALFDGTVAQNVSLSWGSEVDEGRVRTALERAQLLDVIDARVGGIHGTVGDRGMKLSGGQRQRLGIARALYSEPLVLVMDEATSSLDTKTEADVSAAIRDLRGEVSTILVAHRLSTIRDCDEVWFMRNGRIDAKGKFDEVIAAEEEFEKQARLAGLL